MASIQIKYEYSVFIHFLLIITGPFYLPDRSGFLRLSRCTRACVFSYTLSTNIFASVCMLAKYNLHNVNIYMLFVASNSGRCLNSNKVYSLLV